MEDLDICKRIAAIEKATIEDIYIRDGKVLVDNPLLGGHAECNPLTDKALCFDLMVKHKVAIDCSANPYHADVVRERDVYNVSDKNPQRAICLAIIAKHEGNNEN